jgi:magnesium-transporting ATPase (P-type)
MILIEDNFEATMNAVMWGRNIYDNVRRFLQFQITVNLACLTTVLFVASIRGNSYMNTVQLLWVNLIMDTFAAIALASERPHPSIIRNPPTKKGEQVLTPIIWRQIYGVSLYMFIVIALLASFGKFIWGYDYERSTPVFNEDNSPTDKGKHFTMLFNIFVMMQVFNELCCRCIQPKRLNVFFQFFSNWYFLAVIGIVVFVQLFLFQWFGAIFNVAPMTSTELASSILWGASVIIVSTILKLTPDALLSKLPIFVNEDKGIDPNNKLMKAYNDQASAKVTQKKVEGH